MSESLTKLHCEIDDSTTLQIAHLVNRHLKKTFPASQPFICQKFRENLKTLRVAVQSKLAGFSLKGNMGLAREFPCFVIFSRILAKSWVYICKVLFQLLHTQILSKRFQVFDFLVPLWDVPRLLF